MRLITEYMSVPEINRAAISEKLATAKVNKVEAGEPENAENLNLKLAKEVETYRLKLTHALVRFPVTALWVLSNYEQSTYGDEDDESNHATDRAELVAEIKKYYELVSYAAHDKDNNDADYARAVAALSCVLKRFPFGFEDLVKLVDIITFSFKYRGLSFIPETFLDRKQADIILKRLEGTDRRSNSNLADHFRTMEVQYNQGKILFLTVGEMGELLPEIVLAEHNWLTYRQRLASSNTKLVLYIANQYKGNFLDFEDLVQEGHTGLLKAVDRFKYRLGFQFSTYAGYWIRQAISRALSRSERVVRIPCGQIATINKLYRSKDELTVKNGKEPTVAELADYCGLTQDEVDNILAISQTSVALESFDSDDDEPTFAPIDFLEQKVFNHCFNQIADKQLKALMRNAVKTLNSREAKIICSHFGLGTDQQKTLQEIGDELHLTRERVRQIQVVALNKIKMRFSEQLVSFT